ncbi:MAG: GspH/FimT family pseudopilin [Pseudomonadota bacterium]
MKTRSRNRGFTLMELMTAITIMVILAAIAIPSFRSSIAGNRLSTTANDYIAALNRARSEAVRRNTTVQFCGSTSHANGSDTLGLLCGASLGHVYVLDSSGAATKVMDIAAPPAHISVSNDGDEVPALRYGGQGLAHTLASSAPYSGLVADVSSDQIQTRNHRCIYLLTGSSVSSCPSSVSCPTSEPSNCQ